MKFYWLNGSELCIRKGANLNFEGVCKLEKLKGTVLETYKETRIIDDERVAVVVHKINVKPLTAMDIALEKMVTEKKEKEEKAAIAKKAMDALESAPPPLKGTKNV